ncbi:hypothetical protein C8J56DRAFT_1159486 [Mycena floridula]|nr:hypothetical protein C8J56DRAFT_1159486 [Mycena floridula]
MSSSISVAVGHAISFLTRPLAVSAYPPATIQKLRLVLSANLTALYAPTWHASEPLRGSGRRCLTLSPNCLPPRVIYAACIATGVQWFDWMALLGGAEFDFFVDPGCVAFRVGKQGKLVTVWADEVPSPAPFRPSYDKAAIQAAFKRQSAKTFAQELLEHDDEDEEHLFNMIADEIRAPTWKTPVVAHFPSSVRSTSPLSSFSASTSSHSRCSSRSSNSSGEFSVSSSSTSISNSDDQKLSRRERARQARVYVDTSKTEVTPYDGGKTTVLTGGVMLGGGPKTSKPATSSANTWRPARV